MLEESKVDSNEAEIEREETWNPKANIPIIDNNFIII